MSKPINRDILIGVETSFSELQSNVEQEEYFFAYQIRIRNMSTEPVQLLSRKWFITDSSGESRFVEGEGVVGEQPVIEAGSAYSYISGCLLSTGFGKMRGFYTFRNLSDQALFQVPIPEFHLVLPWVLN